MKILHAILLSRRGPALGAAMAGLLAPAWIFGQTLAGVNLLKLVPGARPQGLAGIGAGVIDELQALHANPAAAGFSREWQWAATYSKGIADAYHAALLFGSHAPTPWRRRLHVHFGLLHQGLPEFDSSNGAMPPVSAGDWLASAGLAQPFLLAGEHFALGANVKYLRSKLAQFEASSWMADLGLLYRSRRFRLLKSSNRLLRYGVVSAGVGVANVGRDLTFQTIGTPLPRIWRAGVAFNAGHHEGWQLQLAADYRRVHTERAGAFTLGTEISWAQLVAVRGGYDFHDDLLSHFAMGVSLRLADTRSPVSSVLPGRNNSLRLDLAALEQTDLFTRPYRGSVSHYPVAPERFELRAPAPGALIETDSVRLRWDSTVDPDLYDDVKYLLLVERDSLKLARALALAWHKGAAFLAGNEAPELLIKTQTVAASHPLAQLEGGRYFWTVLAYDTDGHVRAAGTGDLPFWDFHLAMPKLESEAITFDYSPWITTDALQGTLQFRLANTGGGAARAVRLVITDSLRAAGATTTVLLDTTLARMAAGSRDTLRLAWHTPHAGWHRISVRFPHLPAAVATGDAADFATIPKGTLTAADTLVIATQSHILYEVPFIPEICFDPRSTVVKSEYLRKTLLDPPLYTLAQRLQEHPHLKIYLQGFADPNSGETETELAEARAAAVRDSLRALGVRETQIMLQPGEVLPPRRTPANADDARWVQEEWRYVKISADSTSEPVVFQLVSYDDVGEESQPAIFASDIATAVPAATAWLQLTAAGRQEQLEITPASRNGLRQKIVWQSHAGRNGQAGSLAGRQLTHELMLVDSLGRTFHTPPRQSQLAVHSRVREQRVAWPIRFNGTAPLYDFYWAKLQPHIEQLLSHDNMRMRFSGHACAIGPEAVNLRLSQQRAEAFHQTFLRIIRQRYPQDYEKIAARLDRAVGRGETRPMRVEHLSGKTIIIGNNESPLGRKLNRRLEMEFYYKQLPGEVLSEKK
ncbi:MAG: PorV/PorQ family protein [candidate division KSB1 bacterium]|nr:PorV/PorQ family protein [candidate division KSB1 bacterium]MDZ7275937.1 PorV/PorQ family protein [candidate division KSB1 bacterium]MDZ7285781.1 PorV/PorQ family protein [candidate division KSB1 bacterium]MDZ7298813.1 PorV/PorQ family protein [candidate division KSB1 bacterium]MDZ7349678.1 PorV/PorQ family protein [candidate division KSB1 bacterium]